MQEKNYWLLGANWEGEELKETFFSSTAIFSLYSGTNSETNSSMS